MSCGADIELSNSSTTHRVGLTFQSGVDKLHIRGPHSLCRQEHSLPGQVPPRRSVPQNDCLIAYRSLGEGAG